MKDIHTPRAANSGFDQVIAPITRETFFAEYFEKKHLVVRRDDPGYFRDLLSVEDIDTVLTERRMPGDDFNMVNNGNRIEPDLYSMPSGFVDPVRAAQQFSDGGTMIFQGLHRKLSKLAAYCRDMETVFSCDLQTNIYFTPDNAQGFKTHYDSHDVIVLQTHGSKTWNIYESPLELPLRSQAFDPATFQKGEIVDTFVLHAGDMCYVPRGVVHDAIATDEMSLHITTGLLSQRWIDLLVEAIIDSARGDVALRAAVTPGFANEGFDLAGLDQTFRDLMARAAAGIDPARVLGQFASEFRGHRDPVLPGQFLQHIAADAIEPGTEVARRAPLIYRIQPVPGQDGAEDEIVLDIYGTEIGFPLYAEATLRDAMTREGVFRVGELAGDIDAEGQAVLVRRLVREGVLYQP